MKRSKKKIKDVVQYYKGNPALRNSGFTVNYTDHHLSEIYKCMSDFIYFCVNYIKIVDSDSGQVIPFELYDYQKQMAKTYTNNNRIIVLAPRQCGKSVFTIAYLLWVGLFNDYKNIVLIANKEGAAKKILRKLKEMYKYLPFWMKQGITEWNKKQISFENGVNIYAEATSSSGNRGDTASILYIDETAFIEKSIWEDFYTSVYPTIASVKSAQIILSSTPVGYNHFYSLWTMAMNKQNDYVPFRVKWDEIPGRDDEYKRKVIAEFGGGAKGLRKWRQEFECFFVGSGGSLIEGEVLEKLLPKQILESRFDKKLSIYEYPTEKEVYTLISDVAEGVGGDSSTCQVFKMDFGTNKHKQVATYADNTIKTNEFDVVIDQLAKYYNNALVICESNTYGREILNRLVFETEYDNVFFDQETDQEYGLRMTKHTKAIGNSYMKSYIEDSKIELCDFETISELSKYVKKGDVYKADVGQHDDLVTPIVLFSYFLSKKNLVENWFNTSGSKSTFVRRIEEELLPIGFICSGGEEFNLGSVVNNEDEDFNDFDE